MKKTISLLIACLMLLPLLASCGMQGGLLGENYSQSVRLENLSEQTGSVANQMVGYQTKDNDDGTYDLRFVIGMTEEQIAVGVDVTTEYVENGRVVSFDRYAYASRVYSVITGGGQTYSAQNFGFDYLYTLVFQGIPDKYSKEAGNLQVRLSPFGHLTREQKLAGKTSYHGVLTTFDVPKDASVYTGEADVSWYTGNKTEYILTTADQLMGLIKIRKDSAGATTFEGVTIKLDCDMIFNQGTMQEIKARGNGNYLWTELNSNYLFKGILDGQNHVISGVYMAPENSGYKGMLGTLSGNAQIKNLTVCNSWLIAAPAANKQTVGGLAARVTGDGANVTISDVTLNFNVQENGYAVSYVGGMMGEVGSSCESLTLNRCSFYGNVTITGEYAGGLIGCVSGNSTSLSVTDCFNGGNVTASRYAGGLFGRATVYTMSESNCYGIGTVTASACAQKLIGLRSVVVDLSNGARPAAPAGTTALRVMSYNIRFNLPMNDGVYGQQSLNRVDATKQEILSYDADIIGLQEDNGKWANLLLFDDYAVIQDNTLPSDMERTSIYYKKGLDLLKAGNVWLSPNGTHTDVAALTVADLFQKDGKYQMTAAELERLRITESTSDSYFAQALTDYIDDNGTTQACESYRLLNTYPRNATYGVFDVNGTTVIAVNTHLQQRTVNGVYSSDAFQKLRENERLKQLEYLQETIDGLKEEYPNAVVYMTGDWNDTPFSNVYNTICDTYGYSNAAYSTYEKYGVHGSSNTGFDDNMGQTELGTAGGFGDYLDYVFTSEEIQVLKVATGDGLETVIQSDSTEVTVYTSDHLAIVADICFETETSGDPTVPDADDLTGPSYYTGSPDLSWYTGDKTTYTLTTADQLMGLVYLRLQSFGSVTFDGITIKLGRDMVFNRGTAQEISQRDVVMLHLWPMLHSDYAFKGTLDGQNHTVSGIFMKLDSGSKGILGTLAGNAKIQNLTLDNTCIITSSEDGKQDIGVLAGKVVKGASVTISSVSIDGLVTGTGTVQYVGGFIGMVDGNTSSAASVSFNNCEFKGTIDLDEEGTTLGGFVGRAMRATSVTLTDCTFSGSVNGLASCGALVGYKNSNNDRGATVTDTSCTYTGKVNGVSVSDANKIGR